MLYCLINLWALKLFFARNSLLVGHKADVVPLFDHINLFQAQLHHCLVRFLKHLAAILGHEEVYSLEFQSKTTRRNLSITFWEGRELVTMAIAHCGRDVPVMKSTVLLCSQLLSAVSTEPRNILCGGSSLEFIKALDKAPSQKAGIQYPFSLSPMHV